MSLGTRGIICTFADPHYVKFWGLLFPYLIFIARFFMYILCILTLPHVDKMQAGSVDIRNFDRRTGGDPHHESYQKRFDLLARSLVCLNVTKYSQFHPEHAMVRSQCVFHLYL